MRTLIRGGAVLRMDAEHALLDEGFVLVEDDRIAAVGPMSDAPRDAEANHVEDATGCLVTPGLINTHQHHWYHLLKGVSEGLYLEDWVQQVMNPAAAALETSDLIASMRLAAADMLASGTTAFFNHSVSETDEAAVTALAEASTTTGIRQVFGKELRAKTTGTDPAAHRADVEALLAKYSGSAADALFTVALAVESGEHWISSGTMTPELARYAIELAERFDVRISDHVTGGTIDRSVIAFRRRTGLGQAEWLAANGLLTSRSLLAHAPWLEGSEVGLVARAGATVVTCPSSSAFTAGGIPPIRDWLSAGVNVAFGSDGPMVNDSVDVLGLLREAFLLQSVKYLQPAPVPVETLWALPTRNAAAALGVAGRLGELSVGAQADIAIFDLRASKFGGALNPAVNLVLSGGGHEARTVMVNGEIVKDPGGFRSIDVDEVVAEGREAARSLARRAGLPDITARARSSDRSAPADRA